MKEKTRSSFAQARQAMPNVVLCALLCMSAGCSRGNVYAPPPPPEVVVGTAQQRPVTEYHEYTGNTQASEFVQIRARVGGYLDSIHFKDGDTVSEGALLFVIDQRPYKAQLDQAKADLEGKKANEDVQSSVYRRILAELPAKAATPEDADVQKGNYLTAKAAVLQSEAVRRQAQLNLDYTEIHAPITGRIGRRLVDVGNLIVADSTELATIARYDPMYAYFNVNEADFLADLKRHRENPLEMGAEGDPPAASATGGADNGGDKGKSQESLKASGQRNSPLIPERLHFPVEMGLADESGYPHTGYIDFVDNTVDPGTGTILLRGVFSNPRPYYLAPGLFVRIHVPYATNSHALLVPQRALGNDQAGYYLLIVDSKNVVEHRQVKIGPLIDNDMRVIEEGLKPDERFIVEGLQQARAGIKVKPLEEGSTKAASNQRETTVKRR
jgi:RND family efflux transporter MFP subunit